MDKEKGSDVPQMETER